MTSLQRNASPKIQSFPPWLQVRSLQLSTTSSSTAMRHNYERTIRCFELYVRAGAFAADAAAGALLPRDRVLPRSKQVDLWNSMNGALPQYPTFMPYPSWQEFATEEEAAESLTKSHVPTAADAAPAQRVGGGAPETAHAAVGRSVWRKWEGHGWFEAVVTGYDPTRGQGGEHTLVYQQGTPQELVERMNALQPPVPLSWQHPSRPLQSSHEMIVGTVRASLQTAADSSLGHAKVQGGEAVDGGSVGECGAVAPVDTNGLANGVAWAAAAKGKQNAAASSAQGTAEAAP
jgi:hypothetical protein